MAGFPPHGPMESPSSAPQSVAGGVSRAEQEFLTAIERYRITQGRPFPTWSEILEIAAHLGYRKVLPHGTEREDPDRG